MHVDRAHTASVPVYPKSSPLLHSLQPKDPISTENAGHVRLCSLLYRSLCVRAVAPFAEFTHNFHRLILAHMYTGCAPTCTASMAIHHATLCVCKFSLSLSLSVCVCVCVCVPQGPNSMSTEYHTKFPRQPFRQEGMDMLTLSFSSYDTHFSPSLPPSLPLPPSSPHKQPLWS